MRSSRLIILMLAVATWIGLHSSIAAAATTSWSASGASCVPVGTVGLKVTAGAVTAGAGVTATLYCGITKSALVGAFDSIEITYSGGAGGVVASGAEAHPAPSDASAAAVGGLKNQSVTTAELIEMSKATGAETVRCGIQSKGSAGITTETNLCTNSSNIDFNNSFYYVRVVLKSGIVAGRLQTIFGTSLTSNR